MAKKGLDSEFVRQSISRNRKSRIFWIFFSNNT